MPVQDFFEPIVRGHKPRATRGGKFLDIEVYGSVYAESGEIGGDLTVGGTLTLDATGVFQTADTDPRIRISSDASGGAIEFFSGHPAETTEGYLRMLETAAGSKGERLELELRSVTIEHETNTGEDWYGRLAFDVYTDSATGDPGIAGLSSTGVDGFPALASLEATTNSTGNADAALTATATGSGDAEAVVQAFSTSGTARATVRINGTDRLYVGTDGLSGEAVEWDTWTPTHSNLTFGNGSVIARYIQIGNLVIAQWKLTFGSTTSLSGVLDVSLPVAMSTAIADSDTPPMGVAAGYESGGSRYPMIVGYASGNARLYAQNASGTYLTRAAMNTTVPFTWGTNDEIGFTIVYEAA